MQLFATDNERLAFLLETDASFALGELLAQGDELVTEELPEDKRPKYITNYIGSKQKLVDWIWKHTPEDVSSVLDAFTGSAVVAYMYKTKGLSVIANDRLRYSYHAARAIVENSNVRISEDELNDLLADNKSAGTFVRDNFKGLFFANGVHGVIDNIRANADKLSGFKQDIALFALGKTCMSGKGGFGHFSSSTDYGKRQDTPEEFKERFSGNVARINALVFDNGKECKAYNKDINEVLVDVKVDLAYFDPPYATEFSTTNYEKSYHFIEGLMTHWKGLEINKDSKTHHYATDHKTVTKVNANEFFSAFLANSKHIPNWLISYRDHAYPNESEMKDIISSVGMSSKMESQQHKYHISAKHSENSTAMERLFICAKGKSSSKGSAHPLTADMETSLRIKDNMAALADAPFADSLDLLSCQAGTDPVKVTGFMGNKYLMLGWIEKQIPTEAKTVLDAFSGGANVAYHLKRKGMKVIANDLLLFPYHVARAVVENSHETLSEEDIEKILSPNASAGSFIVDNFDGYYYSKKVLSWLDQVWANIQKLSGYKKDLALATLGNTVKAKSLYGQFHRSKVNLKAGADVYDGSDFDSDNSDSSLSASAGGFSENQLTDIPIPNMEASFRRYAAQLNKLVFDSGQECKALHGDALEAVKKCDADVLYLDPPYITEFSNNDYEYSLHFVEGLMNRWADKELLNDNRRSYKSRTHYDRESIRTLIDNLANESRGRYKTVLMSYRDHAFPTEAEIKNIFFERFGQVKVKGMDVEYNIVLGKDSEGKNGRELLFIASDSRSEKKPAAASSVASLAANCHTSIPVEVRLQSNESMSTSAVDLNPNAGDPQFSFIMCRVGTNKNGDHFLPEELSARYSTAINKKIDLKHSQDLTDIVGGIVGSEYVEDETGGRVECVGELYVADTPTAALAYKLMKRGIVSQVSMECDYEAGECSVCGKTVANKNDYCIHLKKYKGAEFSGKPVYEILRGVTFTGLGLLDRKGADENARITQVASKDESINDDLTTGGNGLEDIKNKADDQKEDAAKKKAPDNGGGNVTDPAAPVDDKTRIKELESENKTLKQQVMELQKQVEELQAASKAAENKARAQKLVQRLEKSGMPFDTDDDREQEMNRLAELSDDAFTATEAAYDRMIKGKAECPCGDKQDEKAAEKPESNTSSVAMRANANVRPADIDDKKLSLEDKLKQGFMTAYRERVGAVTGDKN
ncbi:MAG: DNA adenine methylase [Armatimonadota bacterium]